MFTHSIMTALAIAATFSEATRGASTSARKVVLLGRRDGDASAQVDVAAPGAHFVSAWSSLPPAFSQCHQTIQSHVEAPAAIEAVNNIADQATAVAAQYGNIDGHFAAEGSHACIPCQQHFHGIVGSLFGTLQGILSLGLQTYGPQWKTDFQPACIKLGLFIKVVNSLCLSLKIDLGGLLVGLHIDLHLFVALGLNLNVLVSGLLNVVVGSNGLLGGVVGATGLLGGGQASGSVGLLGGLLH